MKNVIFLLIFSVFLLFSCGNSSETGNVSPVKGAVESSTMAKGQSSVIDETSDPNALQVAMSLDDFSTLVVAVQAASIEDALVNAGPLTVFAPTNEAFEKLPEGTVDDLLKPENKDQLAHILKNHVAPANYPVKQLEKEAKKGRKLYMASGEYLDVENRDGGIYVDGKKVLKTVNVSNGWIHVIDEIILPKE